MLFVTQSPDKRVVLPNAPGFSINPLRSRAARTAVAGNVIRQESALHVSTAEATYSREIDKELADALSVMHAANSAVTIFWAGVQYQANMGLQVFPATPDTSRVEIRFSIVRQGL